MHTFRFPCALRASTLAVAMALALPLQAAEFVFEGELQEHGVPANGTFDLQLTPYADRDSARPLAAATEFPAVEVVDGRFRVSLDIPGTDEAPAIAMAVRGSGEKSAYSPLPGRQQAKAGPIGVCWSTTGDEGAIPGTHFIGTTDGAPFEIRAGGSPALRVIPTAGTPNVIAGNLANSVIGASGSVIGGGGSAGAPNSVTATFATVSGGSANHVEGTIGTVSGGSNNRVEAASGVISGGFGNRVQGQVSTVSGGQSNLAIGNFSTVSGGLQNVASGDHASIAAGQWNDSPGQWGSVPGGLENCAGGAFSLAAGLRAKVRPGAESDSPGVGCDGIPTTAGPDGDVGTFVWADGTGTGLISTGPNQFLVRASGGVVFNGNVVPGSSDLVVQSRGSGDNVDLLMRSRESASGINFGATADGTLFVARANLANPAMPTYTDYARWSSTGQFRLFVDNPIKPTAGGFSAPSDARLKEHVAPLENALNRLLALRGSTFEYRKDAPEGFYAPGVQTGFIAQEVEKVFPEWVSTDPSGYKLVGIKGFEALAVEALRELQQQKDAEIETLQMQLDAQREANAALEARLARLEAALIQRVR